MNGQFSIAILILNQWRADAHLQTMTNLVMLGIPAVEFEKGRSHSALQILENGKQLHRLNLTATRGQSPHSWALCPCHLAGNAP